ncbi:MAG: transposase [Bacteroidota bacterium]
MSDPLVSLQPDNCYHIYNHAVGNENIFRSDKNYQSFLAGFQKHIFPIADLLCYGLMKNHFHLVVRVRLSKEIIELINKTDIRFHPNKIVEIPAEQIILFLSQQFSNFFNSYAKAINKENYRRGALFERAFHRKQVITDEYLKRLIRYVHQNPVKDGFATKMDEWKYSSYNSIISLRPSLIVRDDVLELFGDLENFIFYHNQNETGFEL